MSQDERATSKHGGWMMEMDGGNKEDYGSCQEIFFSQVLARPKCFQPLRRNIQKAIFRIFLRKNICFFFLFTFIDFQSITSHCKATGVSKLYSIM